MSWSNRYKSSVNSASRKTFNKQTRGPSPSEKPETGGGYYGGIPVSQLLRAGVTLPSENEFSLSNLSQGAEIFRFDEFVSSILNASGYPEGSDEYETLKKELEKLRPVIGTENYIAVQREGNSAKFFYVPGSGPGKEQILPQNEIIMDNNLNFYLLQDLAAASAPVSALVSARTSAPVSAPVPKQVSLPPVTQNELDRRKMSFHQYITSFDWRGTETPQGTSMETPWGSKIERSYSGRWQSASQLTPEEWRRRFPHQPYPFSEPPSSAPPSVPGAEGYQAAGAPQWWKGYVYSNPSDTDMLLMSINALIPSMSPEDQNRMAIFLSQADPDKFGSYADVPVPPIPKTVTPEMTKAYTSAQRANQALVNLQKMLSASGVSYDKAGPGYKWLESVARIMAQYGGNPPTSGQSNQSYLQMLGQLDPLMQQMENSPWRTLGLSLTNPYFTAGNIVPIQKNGQWTFGKPRKGWF